jgi:hypothetical protein
MVGVFRQKEKAWSKNTIFGYALHGTTALLFIWMFIKAID